MAVSNSLLHLFWISHSFNSHYFNYVQLQAFAYALSWILVRGRRLPWVKWWTDIPYYITLAPPEIWFSDSPERGPQIGSDWKRVCGDGGTWIQRIQKPAQGVMVQWLEPGWNLRHGSNCESWGKQDVCLHLWCPQYNALDYCKEAWGRLRSTSHRAGIWSWGSELLSLRDDHQQLLIPASLPARLHSEGQEVMPQVLLWGTRINFQACSFSSIQFPCLEIKAADGRRALSVHLCFSPSLKFWGENSLWKFLIQGQTQSKASEISYAFPQMLHG